jgi:hypothetical protein
VNLERNDPKQPHPFRKTGQRSNAREEKIERRHDVIAAIRPIANLVPERISRDAGQLGSDGDVRRAIDFDAGRQRADDAVFRAPM